MIIPATIAEIIRKLHSTDKYWIAYSGGLDSHALLHLLSQSFPLQQLTAIHINHGLSVNANLWQEHCRKTCEQLNVAFQAISVNAHPFPGQSPEAAARNARYDALITVIENNAALITAHQQDDQAETVLLQMLRGGGTAGLAAMPAKKIFGQGVLIRPLLNFTRADLLEYAQYHHLKWIDDESNNESRFDRNYLRLELFPMISQRWPHIKSILTKFSKQCADDEAILQTMSQIDINFCQDESDNSLIISKLLQLDEIRQRNTLRYWLRHFLGIFPSRNIIEAIQDNVLKAKKDAQPIVEWQDMKICRYEDHLYILREWQSLNSQEIIYWHNLREPLNLPARLGYLTATWVVTPTFPVLNLPHNAELQIKFRIGGERLHIIGRSGSHPLKKLFQEWHIPPWLRDRVPLIYYDDKFIAVPGLGIAQQNASRIGESGYLIQWHTQSPSPARGRR